MRKNPEKTSPRKLIPTGDRTRARCMTSARATTWPRRWTSFGLKICMGGEFHSELVSVYQWFGSIEPVRKPGNLTQSFLSKYVRKPSLHKTDFSGVDISGSIGNRNKGSSVLYSPWTSDHLYSHQNNWITISILQYKVTS